MKKSEFFAKRQAFRRASLWLFASFALGGAIFIFSIAAGRTIPAVFMYLGAATLLIMPVILFARYALHPNSQCPYCWADLLHWRLSPIAIATD